MAFDELLGERLRERMMMEPGVTERRMFGGLAFMIGGNMSCGVIGEDLVVRCDPREYAEVLALPHAREMDFNGRPMLGWVYVAPEGTQAEEDLDGWVERGSSYARSLPVKAPKRRKA